MVKEGAVVAPAVKLRGGERKVLRRVVIFEERFRLGGASRTRQVERAAISIIDSPFIFSC